MKRTAKVETQASILGTRIRQKRRELGLKQTEVAQSVGISPSYLNLIEWNKRSVAGALLRRIAEELELTLDDLDGAAEKRLHETLLEIAELPALSSHGIENNRTSELIGRFPGWARALATIVRSEHEAVKRAQALSDRLSNNPFLNENVHRMLTRSAAIRSAAEILYDNPNLSKKQRERFIEIVHDESRTLSNVGEALSIYLDNTDEKDRILTPLDEVESLFESRENHFDEIEIATTDLTKYLTDTRPVSRHEKARALTSENLLDAIERLIADQPIIKTEAARKRAHRALYNYAVNAILMPLNAFITQCRRTRFDIESLAEIFSVNAEAVFHRLTALPAKSNLPNFGYIQANAAGTIIEMMSLEGLVVPRYSTACPLWVLYRAQQSPEALIRQRALFPSGKRFVLVARAHQKGPTGFGKPRHYVTDMLIMSEKESEHTIYAPDHSSTVEEVGPNCRMCPRHACLHRVEDPLAE